MLKITRLATTATNDWLRLVLCNILEVLFGLLGVVHYNVQISFQVLSKLGLIEYWKIRTARLIDTCFRLGVF